MSLPFTFKISFLLCHQNRIAFAVYSFVWFSLMIMIHVPAKVYHFHLLFLTKLIQRVIKLWTPFLKKECFLLIDRWLLTIYVSQVYAILNEVHFLKMIMRLTEVNTATLCRCIILAKRENMTNFYSRHRLALIID